MSTKRITVPAMLVLALAIVAIALRGKGRLAQTPEEAVNLFFQAAQRGDAPAFLAVLTGTLRSSFESTRSQIGAAAFVAGLRESVAGIKGFAVSAAGRSQPGQAELDVELVFSDHNERQRFVLLRQSGGWLVASIDKADVVKPPSPYGAPAFDADTAPVAGTRRVPSAKYGSSE
jgi:hypothetical protein